MARRASSSIHPGSILAIVAGIAALGFAGKFFLGKKSGGFGDIAPLRVEELLENGNSLRGNEYYVEGKIDEKLRWTANSGQVVSVRVSSDAGEQLIGVEIPAGFNNLNIEREQRYSIRLKVREGGIPVATGITRL